MARLTAQPKRSMIEQGIWRVEVRWCGTWHFLPHHQHLLFLFSVFILFFFIFFG